MDTSAAGTPGGPSSGLSDPIITITPAAHAHLVGLRDAEPDADRLGLRLEITNDTPPEFSYDLSFEVVTQAALSDEIRNHDGLRVIIAARDVPSLDGATLDYGPTGLVIRNPNRPRPRDLAGVELDRDGELATGIASLLDREINPALAAHGGFVTLLGTDADNVAYLTMGGGCQGCAMSRMTMVQGVEASIKQAFPQVTRVIDATDHSVGAMPYYT